MQLSSYGIVLTRIKYGDTSIISKIYTKQFGLRSFLAKGVRKKRARLNYSLFNPFTVVELEFIEKQGREVQILKDLRQVDPTNSLSINDPKKAAIAYFLAEVFASTLQEDEFDQGTFNFMLTTISDLIDLETAFGQYSPLVLWKFTHHLGILPSTETKGKFFNISSGEFQQTPFGAYPIDENTSQEIKSIFTSSIQANPINNAKHLEIALNYFQYHIPYFKKPKSLEILKAIFN